MTKSANFKKWFTFVVLVIGGGTIFKLSSLKDAFYVPMQEFMGLTHTQIGAALSVYGLVQTIGNFASIYISDRFSKRIMISFSCMYWVNWDIYINISRIWRNIISLGITFFLWGSRILASSFESNKTSWR